MHTYAKAKSQRQRQAQVRTSDQQPNASKSGIQLMENRPPAGAPGAFQALTNSSPMAAQLRSYQALANQGTLQCEAAAPACASCANNTGLPDNLKAGVEALSGMSLDNVRVHYNSAQPAQLNALAYAQGRDIHLAPGQERHLPHEAWHIVQQAQGRVRPTMQMKHGVPVNDDAGLEREADVMGDRANGAAQLRGVSGAVAAGRRAEVPGSLFQPAAPLALAAGTTLQAKWLYEDDTLLKWVPTGKLTWYFDLDTKKQAFRVTPGASGIPKGVRDLANKPESFSVFQLEWQKNNYAPVVDPVPVRGLDNAEVANNPPSQKAEARLMGELVKANLDGVSGPQIPKLIHRFWSGGPMSDAAMEILVDAAVKTKDSPWKNMLWHSEAIEHGMDPELGNVEKEKRQSQRMYLSSLGYQINNVEKLLQPGVEEGISPPVTDEFMLSAGNTAADSWRQGDAHKWDDIKYYSDYARLLYLHQLGGFHMDIDVGLGSMDLTTDYFHNDAEGNIPLMGSILRDSKGADPELLNALKLVNQAHQDDHMDATDEEFRNAVEVLTKQAKTGSGMFNALIATRADNPNVAYALKQLIEKSKKSEMLVSGMMVNRHLLSGEEREGQPTFDEAAPLSIPPHLLRLQHLTPESESPLEQSPQESSSEKKDRKEKPGSVDGKKCFLTTACMDARGRSDHCYELTVLRRFRDEYLLATAAGRALVGEYYRIAPKIVGDIDARPDGKLIWANLYARLVLQSVAFIEDERYPEAVAHYREVVYETARAYSQ